MRAPPLAALLRLLLLAGGATYANPFENESGGGGGSRASGVWLELPRAHVALEGDLHGRLRGLVAADLHLRLKREDDDGVTLLAAMPLRLDTERRFSVPCGYFSRGGTYYIELVTDIDSDLPDLNVIGKVDAGGYLNVTPSEKGVDERDIFISDDAFNRDNFISDDAVKRDNFISDDAVKRDNFISDDAFKRDNFISDDAVNRDNFISDDAVKRDNFISDKAVKRDNFISDDAVERASEGAVREVEARAVRSWRLEVRWPAARLSVTPERLETYPERPVSALLEFPRAVCAPLRAGADFWLELLYCGHASGGAVLCDGRNASTSAHVLSSEQVHGFPGRRTITLRCELFGQAGDYALTLRPAAAALPQDYAAVFIKADWSEQFVLNVHGGSVFPCGGGVRALFQYPACVLERADRVRLFGRDGEKLRYVTERRVSRGQHTATFDCRLFSERYPEYCFVYVSQAVTGAVANVRMDCLPTLPLSEGAAAGWGDWSAWSPCPEPTRCSTATRSRHRFCDSPPPAYGAKYCEGRAVEIAMCACAAAAAAAAWEDADAPAVVAEVGVGCRCGCVLHLARHPRLLAGSTRACPGHSFWLLKAEAGMSVRLRVEGARLPCAGQTLRARAGDSLAAPLVASWDAVASRAALRPAHDGVDGGGGAVEVVAGRHILVDLRTEDGGSEQCAGGFIAHAQQIDPIHNASAAWMSGGAGGADGAWAAWWSRAGAARAAAMALAAAAAAAALLLALHSAARTRAYQRAADKESLTDSDACSASLELVGAGSRSTLCSELAPVVRGRVSLRRLLPARARHRRLRESCLVEDETRSLQDSEGEGDAASEASSATITPEGAANSVSSAPAAPAAAAASPAPRADTLRRSHTVADAAVCPASHAQITSPDPPPSVASETATAELSTSMSSVSGREGDSCSEKDRDSVAEREARCDSEATISSRTSSAATLTNGWYSPALNGVCAARVRGNPKHSKESSNRRRVLRASELSLTSNQQEMEMDYYDYEVNNAGAAPGSYLGMDPAFLVWIPPLDQGDIIQEIDEKQAPLYEEIMPSSLYPDPGSNTESPEADQPSTLKRNIDNKSGEPLDLPGLSNVIHPLNFSISDLQKDSPKLPRRNSYRNRHPSLSIPMKELSLSTTSQSPVRVHRKLESKSEVEAENHKRKLSDLSDIKFADDVSDSSNEIKFMDDDTPDSNKLSDKLDVKV